MPVLAPFSRGPGATAGSSDYPRPNRLLFTSQGKTGLVSADGSGLRYVQFDKPGVLPERPDTSAAETWMQQVRYVYWERP